MAAGGRALPPAAHLAHLGGTATNVAHRALENWKELPALDGIGAALRAGVLSSVQLEAIVPAAVADPSAQDRLVAAAAATNLSELRAECLRAHDRPANRLRNHPAANAKARAKVRYFGLLHLPYEALIRGAVAGDETCEIVGIGPVPVRSG